VVIVNYDTRELISQLVFSLCRVLGRDQLARLVVVDNRSTDGSRETLAALAGAGLIDLVENRGQQRHGPGLNRGISWLADAGRVDETDLVWVLDSDVVVLRRAVVRAAVDALREQGAAMVGQEEERDAGEARLPLNSLLIDPARIWRRPVEPFFDRGDPSDELQRSASEHGLELGSFPFRHDSHLVHLGRGTLIGVAERGESDHPMYGWALERQGHHFGGHPLGKHLHDQFLAVYREEVPDDEPATLVAACGRTELLTFPDARPLPPLEELKRLVAEGDAERKLLERP
jgi:glycosyltransferase involved in cell wall biosynthesis